MSFGVRTFNPQIITNGSMTGTSVITSSIIDTTGLSSCSVHLVWTGTPNGTFLVKGSNDGTTFTAITTIPASLVASGAAGDLLINLAPWPYAKFEVIYTNASSTGTLNAWFCGKGL
jgi:hypothetical protein